MTTGKSCWRKRFKTKILEKVTFFFFFFFVASMKLKEGVQDHLKGEAERMNKFTNFRISLRCKAEA